MARLLLLAAIFCTAEPSVEAAEPRMEVAAPDAGVAVAGAGVAASGVEGLVAERVELGDEVALRLLRPAQWVVGEPMEVSLRGAPGAEWAARQAWGRQEAELQLACARAPAGAWVSGMQSLLLDGASAMTRQAAGAPSLQAQAAQPEAGGYRQSFTLGEGGEQGRGQHLLGFAGGGSVVLVCTLVCRGGEAMCERSLGSMLFSGQLAKEPTDTVPARTIALLAAHPSAALAALVMSLLLIVGWVLARRPRPQR